MIKDLVTKIEIDLSDPGLVVSVHIAFLLIILILLFY
jgi:hypothetical protein